MGFVVGGRVLGGRIDGCLLMILHAKGTCFSTVLISSFDTLEEKEELSLSQNLVLHYPFKETILAR